MIKTETLLLSSGAAGEAAARIAEHPVTFSRVTVGDGNGNLPTLDVTRTQLDNPVTNGDVAIIVHDLDPNDPTQRVLTLRIDNNTNYDARELLIYASADGVEFPHTYIRLGAAYPVRTLANGGVSIEIEAIIKVATEGEFSITHTDIKVVDNIVDVAPDTAASSRIARWLYDQINFESSQRMLADQAVFEHTSQLYRASYGNYSADPDARLDPCFLCHHVKSPYKDTAELWWVNQKFLGLPRVDSPRLQTWVTYKGSTPRFYIRTYYRAWTDFVEIGSAAAQQRADYAVQFARSNQPTLTEMHENITAPEARYQTIVRMGGDELFIDDVYQEGDVIMIDNRDTALLTLRGELSFFLPGSPDPVGEITTSLICRFSITATAGGFYITPLWAKETR